MKKIIYFSFTLLTLVSCSNNNNDNSNNNGGNTSNLNMEELDLTFNVGEGFSNPNGNLNNSYIFKIAPFQNGILVANKFASKYKGVSVGQVCKLNLDGSLDNSFSTLTSFANIAGDVYDILVLSDGKIAVSGNFTVNNVNETKGIAILNANGSLDNSFNVGGTGLAGNGVYALKEDSQGRIFAGGLMFKLNEDYYSKNIVCFNRNGSVNTNFQITGNGFNGEIDDIEIKDNKLWVVGRFSIYGGTATKYMAILNLDGTLNKTFDDLTDDGSFVDGASRIAFQSSGKALVVGGFRTSDNTNSVARFNSDGTFDSTFLYNDFFNDGFSPIKIRSLAIMNNDDIVVGGDFAYQSYRFISVLKSDGTVHPNFNTINSFTFSISALYVSPQQEIYVGGSFLSYENTSIGSIARLKGNKQ